MGLWSRAKELYHSWNAFRDHEQNGYANKNTGGSGYGTRPDKVRLRYTNERSLLASIFTRLSIDCSAVDIRHVRTDDNGRYLSDMKTGLNDCLTVEANLDQAARHFRRDIFLSMFDRGVIAIAPIEATEDPEAVGSWDVKQLRVADIVNWRPQTVLVNAYDQRDGRRKDLEFEKRICPIVENPFYSVMNEPNSTLKRLVHKLTLLDAVDDQISSGKLDVIIQLPYVVKSPVRQEQANQRRADLENQLKGSKYGIAYIDGTEKITQLNRPAENNLLKTVEYLTNQLYTELGLTPEIMNGTADEAAMLNYHNRTIEPLVTAVVEAMRRTFLTKTARSQNQDIMFFRDPFKLVPVGQIADIADKFARNEIASANDIRQIVGWKPSTDPNADKLINSNMPQPQNSTPAKTEERSLVDEKKLDQNRPVGVGS